VFGNLLGVWKPDEAELQRTIHGEEIRVRLAATGRLLTRIALLVPGMTVQILSPVASATNDGI